MESSLFFFYLVPQASDELEETTVSNFQQELVYGCHYKTSHAEPTPTINDDDRICTTNVPVLSVEDMLLAAQERIHEGIIDASAIKTEAPSSLVLNS